MYDVSIWEEISSLVKPQTKHLIDTISNRLANDSSLAEFRRETLPWQFGAVLEQRANSWVQKLYEICGQARDATGKPRSREFNYSVWAYCIEPFIQEGTPARGTYTKSPLLNLLFHAVKGEPNPPGGLALRKRDLCLNVRNHVWDTWRSKLLGILSQREEAAAALGRYNAMEANARRLLRGLPQQSPPSAESGSREGPGQPVTNGKVVDQNPSQVDTPQAACSDSKIPTMHLLSWQDIEIRFLSDHRVEIRAGQRIETRSYGEFAFEDKRSGKPIEAWSTLCELAQKEGVIKNAAHLRGDWLRVEKHIQQIRKMLQSHFKITSDPLPYIPSVGYRAAFKIRCAPCFKF